MRYEQFKTAPIAPTFTLLTSSQADFRQPNFKSAFYGANYDKLRAIKKKYDPADLFYAITAVGSDEWEVSEDGRMCRVGQSGTATKAFTRSTFQEALPDL